jgi:hypothetical protein
LGVSLWWKVFGFWSLVFGGRSLEEGLWLLVFGLWSLEEDLWVLVFGCWSLVFGEDLEENFKILRKFNQRLIAKD